MNNKKIGTQFEQEFCKYLAEHGWWAHFLTPSAGGSQPFDVIAMRDSDTFCGDCKTCAGDRFAFSRIEDNQRLAFDDIIWKTTHVNCGIVVKYNDEIYFIAYSDILEAELAGKKSIKLTEELKNYASSCFE